MAWVMIRKQLVCVKSVYGPQTGRTEAEKHECRDALESMIGMAERGGNTTVHCMTL